MGKLKDAVMTVMDEVLEETGREIDFDEAGRILMARWAVKPSNVTVLDLPIGERAKAKCLGPAENKGEFKFELLEDTESLKKGAVVVLRDNEINVVEVA